MMYPVPTLGKAYSIPLHDESQREIQPSGGPFLSESTSFSVKSTPAPAQFTNGPKSFSQKINFDIKRIGLVCKYCKKPTILLTNVTNFMGSQVTSNSQRVRSLLLVLKLIFLHQRINSVLRISPTILSMGSARNNINTS